MNSNKKDATLRLRVEIDAAEAVRRLNADIDAVTGGSANSAQSMGVAQQRIMGIGWDANTAAASTATAAGQARRYAAKGAPGTYNRNILNLNAGAMAAAMRGNSEFESLVGQYMSSPAGQGMSAEQAAKAIIRRAYTPGSHAGQEAERVAINQALVRSGGVSAGVLGAVNRGYGVQAGAHQSAQGIEAQAVALQRVFERASRAVEQFSQVMVSQARAAEAQKLRNSGIISRISDLQAITGGRQQLNTARTTRPIDARKVAYRANAALEDIDARIDYHDQQITQSWVADDPRMALEHMKRREQLMGTRRTVAHKKDRDMKAVRVNQFKDQEAEGRRLESLAAVEFLKDHEDKDLRSMNRWEARNYMDRAKQAKQVMGSYARGHISPEELPHVQQIMQSLGVATREDLFTRATTAANQASSYNRYVTRQTAWGGAINRLGARMGFLAPPGGPPDDPYGNGGRGWQPYGNSRINAFNRLNHLTTNISQIAGMSLYGLGTVGLGVGMSKMMYGDYAEARSAQGVFTGMANTYGTFRGADGRELSGPASFARAQAYGSRWYDQVRTEAAKTGLLTTTELKDYAMSGIPALLQKGKGITFESALSTTSRIASLGKAMGYQETAVISDLRDLAAGRVTSRSQVLMALGMKPEELSKASSSGGTALTKYLDTKLAGYDPALKQMSDEPQAVIAKASDALQRASIEAGGALAQGLTPAIKEFTDMVKDNVANGNIRKFAEDFGGFVSGAIKAGTRLMNFVGGGADTPPEALVAGVAGAYGASKALGSLGNYGVARIGLTGVIQNGAQAASQLATPGLDAGRIAALNATVAEGATAQTALAASTKAATMAAYGLAAAVGVMSAAFLASKYEQYNKDQDQLGVAIGNQGALSLAGTPEGTDQRMAQLAAVRAAGGSFGKLLKSGKATDSNTTALDKWRNEREASATGVAGLLGNLLGGGISGVAPMLGPFGAMLPKSEYGKNLGRSISEILPHKTAEQIIAENPNDANTSRLGANALKNELLKLYNARNKKNVGAEDQGFKDFVLSPEAEKAIKEDILFKGVPTAYNPQQYLYDSRSADMRRGLAGIGNVADPYDFASKMRNAETSYGYQREILNIKHQSTISGLAQTIEGGVDSQAYRDAKNLADKEAATNMAELNQSYKEQVEQLKEASRLRAVEVGLMREKNALQAAELRAKSATRDADYRYQTGQTSVDKYIGQIASITNERLSAAGRYTDAEIAATRAKTAYGTSGDPISMPGGGNGVLPGLPGQGGGSVSKAIKMSAPRSLGGLLPHVAQARDTISSMFGINDIGGYRRSATDPHGHPAGRALDIMVPDNAAGKAKGDQIVQWGIQNQKALGLQYIIWQQKILNFGSHLKNGQPQWRTMKDRGSRTANHFDHPHFNFNSGAGSGAVSSVSQALGAATQASALSGTQEEIASLATQKEQAKMQAMEEFWSKVSPVIDEARSRYMPQYSESDQRLRLIGLSGKSLRIEQMRQAAERGQAGLTRGYTDALGVRDSQVRLLMENISQTKDPKQRQSMITNVLRLDKEQRLAIQSKYENDLYNLNAPVRKAQQEQEIMNSFGASVGGAAQARSNYSTQKAISMLGVGGLSGNDRSATMLRIGARDLEYMAGQQEDRAMTKLTRDYAENTISGGGIYGALSGLLKPLGAYNKSMASASGSRVQAAGMEERASLLQRMAQATIESLGLVNDKLRKLADDGLDSILGTLSGPQVYDYTDGPKKAINDMRSAIPGKLSQKMLDFESSTIARMSMGGSSSAEINAYLQSTAYKTAQEKYRTEQYVSLTGEVGVFADGQRLELGRRRQLNIAGQSAMNLYGGVMDNPLGLFSGPSRLGILNSTMAPYMEQQRQKQNSMISTAIGIAGGGLSEDQLRAAGLVKVTGGYKNVQTGRVMSSRQYQMESLGALAGNIGGSIVGNWLGTAVGGSPDSVNFGTQLGGMLGPSMLAKLGGFAGPVGMVLGGLLGGLFGKKGKERDFQEEQWQKNVEGLLNSIDKSLRPVPDIARTISGQALYGQASRYLGGRFSSSIGQMSAVGFRGV